jgi:hypothetical protein
MKKLLISLLALLVLLFTGCGGGGSGASSIPGDDDNISVVKVTDLRLGYLVKGILDYQDVYDANQDIKFCNYDVAGVIYNGGDGDGTWTGTYEISEGGIIVMSSGSMIDTSASGTLKEGVTYLYEGPGGDIFTWYVGSISVIECIVEPE